jgi:hypothetical protein
MIMACVRGSAETGIGAVRRSLTTAIGNSPISVCCYLKHCSGGATLLEKMAGINAVD